MRLFRTILLLSGYHKFLEQQMYWETTLDALVQAVSDAMLRSNFKRILQYLHQCDNKKIDQDDKLCKVRPVIDHI